MGGRFPAGWRVAGKPCDSCKLAAAILYCRVDAAFLCLGCDSKIHGTIARHERVWMCEVCENAAASVTCKADAATLCVTCDRDIHTANPLARRHERVPVMPFYDIAEAVAKSAAAAAAFDDYGSQFDHTGVCHEEVPVPSWIDFTNLDTKCFSDEHETKSIEFLFPGSDPLLFDFEYPISLGCRFQPEGHTHFQPELHNSGNDSVVPIQNLKISATQLTNQFEIDLSPSKRKLSQHISSPSMDFGVVPDESSITKISYPLSGSTNTDATDFGSNPMNHASQQQPVMDREARVLRYREKRKNRKFEKTIRYASRKAYAETRPRIKGRFAKRTDIEEEVNHHRFNSGPMNFILDTGYGIVPSF